MTIFRGVSISKPVLMGSFVDRNTALKRETKAKRSQGISSFAFARTLFRLVGAKRKSRFCVGAASFINGDLCRSLNCENILQRVLVFRDLLNGKDQSSNWGILFHVPSHHR